MKATITFAFVLLSGLLFAQTAEENAIKETLESETTAFMDRDHEAWASYWDQEGDVFALVTNLQWKSDSWEEINQMLKDAMTENPEPIEAELQSSDYYFSINGDRAFVTYDQTFKSKDMESKSYEIRNLRKVDGQWKIATMITSPMPTEQAEASTN